MKGFYNFIRGMFGWIVRLIYPIKVIGDKNNIPRDGKIVLLSNHLSYKDIPALVVHFPGYRHFLAKKEFTKHRIVKWFFTKMGAFFVDRGNLDLSAIRTGVNYLKSGEGIAMFPEGTRNRTNEDIQQVKGGAAMFAVKGQAPIVMVIFQRKLRAFRKTLVYVSERIELDEFYGKKLDSPTLKAATDIITARMEEDKRLIDEYALEASKKKKNKELPR